MKFLNKSWKFIVGTLGLLIGLVWFMNVNSNKKVNVIINVKVTEHVFDKFGRLYGLTSWFESNKIESETPILLLIKDNGIELQLKVKFDEVYEQKLRALVIEILDKLDHNGDTYDYSDIGDIWDYFENSSELTLSQLKTYMKIKISVKKNWREKAKHEKEGIKKYKFAIKTSKTIIATLLSSIISTTFTFLMQLLIKLTI